MAEGEKSSINEPARGGTMQEALEELDQLGRAVAAYRELGEEQHLVRAYSVLGLAYAPRKEWKPALEYYDQALRLAQRTDDLRGAAVPCGHARQGEWERAAELCRLDLEVSEQAKQLDSVAKTCNNLGIASVRLGQGQRALEYYQRAAQTYEQLADTDGLSSTWANMGLLYLQAGHPDEAKPLLANATLVLSKLKHPDAQAAAKGLAQACGSVEAANEYLNATSSHPEGGAR